MTEPTTADKAAALGMPPTAYRTYRHDAAVEQIREAVPGLFAETGQRVMDALTEPTTPPAPADLRDRITARLWDVAEHTIVAEWICCEPINPEHELCVQGSTALRMVRALLVDDPAAARPAPLADAVLSVLPAPADRVAACPECGDAGACNGGPCPLVDRQARYAAALAVSEELDWELIKAQYPNDAATYRKNADAVMAVADAEVVQAMRAMHDTKEEEREAHRLALSEALGLGTGAPWDAIRDRAAELRAEVENNSRYIKRLDTEYDGLRAEWAALRAEVERLRTDRAAVLREAADYVAELLKETPEYGLFVAEKLRRLADEAQQPECAASTSGTCLAEQQSEDPCDTEASECVHGGRPGDEAQQPETEAHVSDADRIVAYRNTDMPAILMCREHAKGRTGLTPLTSEDLPDGGICTWFLCDRDVLATPAPSEEPK